MFFVGHKTDRLLQIMKKHLAFLAVKENENLIKKLRKYMGSNESIAVCNKNITHAKKLRLGKSFLADGKGGGA